MTFAPKSVFDSYRSKHASIVCMQEPNCDFKQRRCVQALDKHIKNKTTYRHWAYSSSSSNPSANSTYLPGGTATIVRDHWATRFNESGGDTEMGRWSYISLNMDDNKTLLFIITAYRVCLQPCDPTTNTASMQQRRILLSQGIATEPRDKCLIDLTAFITSIHTAGHKVIMSIDANSNINDEDKKLDQFVESCGLICCHEARFHLNPPNTYIRGTQQVDYCFCTQSILPAIKGSGFLPFNDGHESDHRILWVDFHGPSLFGQKTAPVKPPPKRNLNSSNPNTLKPYITNLGKLFTEHKILPRARQLKADFEKHGQTEALIARYQALDKEKSELMVCAEKKCADTRHRSAIPWSPEVKQTALLFRYWDLRIRQMRTHTSFQNTLDDIATAVIPTLQILHRTKLTRDQLHHQRKLALASLKAAQKDALKLREQFLDERASLYALTHNVVKAGAIKSIKSAEKYSAQFRVLRTTFNGAQGEGITSIEVLDPDTGLINTITEPKELQKSMINSNAERFHQHEETPFGQGIRSDRLGRNFDDSIDANALLEGEYDYALDDLTPEASDWLLHLQKSEQVQQGKEIDITITPEDFVLAWSKYRESTASNPRLHYGHYKAAAVAFKMSPTLKTKDADGNYEDNPYHNTSFAIVHSIMCEIPLRYGFAPERWQMSINAMLLKSSGSRRVEKLRIIHLLEADFNFVLKLIWGKRLIDFCEDNKLLSDDNAGGRHGQSAHDPSLVKTLALDITRLSKTCIILVDNDAKGCYDRIIKNLAMIACVANGLPVSTANMHNMILDGMVHYVKTAHGISEACYKATHGGRHSEGSGQGSGASPCIWLIFSDTMLKTLKGRTKGMHFFSPDKSYDIDISAIMFVDDNTPGVNDMGHSPSGLTIDQLFSEATLTAQTWERILFASGGSLELSKCFTSVIAWNWINGVPKIIQPDEYSSRVTLVRGNDPLPHTLRSNPPELGERTLGVRPAPDGNWDNEFEHRHKQAKTFARQIRGSLHGRDTYQLAYRSKIKPSMTYPLSITSMTDAQCGTIDKALRPALLPALGFARNLPLGIALGPSADGGQEIHVSAHEQGIRKITIMAGHMRQGGRASDVLHICIDWCQIIAGVSYPILRYPSNLIPHEEKCWIIHLRGFMKQHNLAVELTSSWSESIQRHGDFHLMERIGPQHSPLKATRLNYCRLWLRVSRLSDITHPDGKTLLDQALYGDPLPHRRSTLVWPRIPRPPKHFWNFWRKQLLRMLSVDGKSNKLRTPLGPWNQNIKQSEWTQLYDPVSDRLLTRETPRQHGYRQHPPTGRTTTATRRFGAPQAGSYVQPSNTAVPVMAKRRNHCDYVIARPCPITQHPTADPPSSFWGFVDIQPMLIRRLFFHHIRQWDDDKIYTRIAHRLSSSGRIDVATDGGVLYGIGAFAWVFDLDDTTRIRCSGPADGNTPDIDPKRAELYGILSLLTFLRLLIEYYSPVIADSLKLRLHCDDKNTVNEIAGFRDMQHYDSFATTKRCCANYDVIDEILMCLSQLPLKISIVYIKGHQDSDTPFEELSTTAQLNCIADEICSQQLQRFANAPGNFNNPGHFPSHQCSVLHNHRRITGPLQKRLRTICATPAIEKYWQHKFKWNQGDISNLDRPAFSRVYLSLPKADQRRVSQFRCDWLPVNKRCCKWMPSRTDACPSCRVTAESVDHLLRCYANTHDTSQLEQSLRESMEKARFHQDIIDCVLEHVTRWFFPYDIYPEPHLPSSNCILLAVHAQSAIGWGNFLRGFIAKQWSEANAIMHETRHDTPMLIQLGASMVRPCIKYFLQRWLARNASLHGGTKEEQESKQQILRNIRINEYAEAARRILPVDRKELFTYRPSAIKKLSPAQQKNWLSFAHVFLPRALQRYANRRTSGQTHMSAYFTLETYNPLGIPTDPSDSPGTQHPNIITQRNLPPTDRPTTYSSSTDDPDSGEVEFEWDVDSNDISIDSMDSIAHLDMAEMLQALATRQATTTSVVFHEDSDSVGAAIASPQSESSAG